MLQKSYAEGLRALVLYTAIQQDSVDQYRLAHGGAEPEKGSPEHLTARINDLLLPIVKGCGSERAWVLLGTESLQTYGGSGFLQDYPVEQYVRDAKIDTLYEGTTAIQGQDFFFRKIVRDQGRALQALAAEMMKTVAGPGEGEDALAAERKLLGTAIEDLQGIIGYLIGAAMQSNPKMAGENADIRNLYRVGQNTTRLLLAAGDVIIGWLLLRQAEVATAKLAAGASGADEAFYTGKVAAATFFTHQVLPRLSAERAMAESTDNGLMDVPEAAF